MITKTLADTFDHKGIGFKGTGEWIADLNWKCDSFQQLTMLIISTGVAK